MLTGSCLCGALQYQLQCEIDTLVFCHCSRCRKESGSAFNSATVISDSDIQFINGLEMKKIYSLNGVSRHFCSGCGSTLYTVRDNAPHIYRLRVGTLDSAIYPKQKMHVFAASKASWDEICDNAPQFAERPE